MTTESSWSAPDLEPALDRLAETLAQSRFPTLPRGFELIDKNRTMRIVIRGTLERPRGAPFEAVIKWHAPHVRGVRSGSRAAREGSVMRQVGERGLAVPEVLGWRSRPAQFLATRWIPDLVAIPTLEGADPDLHDALCELVANARRRGLWHRDLHLGNVALRNGRPLLLDFGNAILGGENDPWDVDWLGHIHHASLNRLSVPSQLRWLHTYAKAVGCSLDRTRLCELTSHVSKRSAKIARRYRRGRDRRATRSGRHFHATVDENRVRTLCAIRDVPEDLPALTRSCFEAAINGHRHVPLGERTYVLDPIKSTGHGTSVFRLHTANGAFAVKAFQAVPMFRRTRARRAFISAFALTNRYLPVPRALSCRWATTGEGIVISEWIDAPDLHAHVHDPSKRGYASLADRERRDLLHHVGRTLRHLHECALTHRDLKAPNMLVRPSRHGRPAMWFVDLDGIRVRRRVPGWPRRAKDLARLDASLRFPRGDRRMLWESYLGVWPRPPIGFNELDEMMAPHVKRKRGPSGLPR